MESEVRIETAVKSSIQGSLEEAARLLATARDSKNSRAAAELCDRKPRKRLLAAIRLTAVRMAFFNVGSTKACKAYRALFWRGLSELRAEYEQGWTPWHFAAYFNSQAAANGLLQTMNNPQFIHAASARGTTPLHLATANNSFDMIRTLMGVHAAKQMSDSGANPLHVAAARNGAKAARLLLELGAAIWLNARNSRGNSPVKVASICGHLGVTLTLLSQRADVHLADETGATAAHEASAQGHVQVLRALLEHEADPQATTKAGFTPLFVAAQRGDVKTLNLLVAHRAAVDAGPGNAASPLFIAVQLDEPKAVRSLIRMRADVSMRNSKGNSPLHRAAHDGRSGIVKALVQARADVKALSQDDAWPNVSSRLRHAP